VKLAGPIAKEEKGLKWYREASPHVDFGVKLAQSKEMPVKAARSNISFLAANLGGTS
jgi:hypothetical protein